jgi:hypothetical protein
MIAIAIASQVHGKLCSSCSAYILIIRFNLFSWAFKDSLLKGPYHGRKLENQRYVYNLKYNILDANAAKSLVYHMPERESQHSTPCRSAFLVTKDFDYKRMTSLVGKFKVLEVMSPWQPIL